MPSNLLVPTVWRTCRVLANRSRLRLLELVCEEKRVCVSVAARRAGLSEGRASTALRALQARGLLSVARESRWVYYLPQHDPLVEHAEAVLQAASRAFSRGDTAESMVRAFTAFTHPRRLAIVAEVAARPMTGEHISRTCRISYPAVRRHLFKLLRRGMLLRDDSGLCRVNPAPGPLEQDLLSIVTRPVPHDHTS